MDFGILECLALNILLHVEKWAKLGRNLLGEALLELDFLLAARALHEGEGDAQGRPAVLEQLYEAVCVENVAAAELRAGLLAELTRVADSAELFLIDTLEVSGLLRASWLEARKAPLFLGNTFAGVSATFVGLLAECQGWLFLRHDHLLLLLDFLFLLVLFNFLVFFLLLRLSNSSRKLDVNLKDGHAVGGLAGEGREDLPFKHRL